MTSPGRSALLFAGMALLALPEPARGQVAIRSAGGLHEAVTLVVDGPVLDARRGPNPFADFRLDVTFSDGSRDYRVPGYFAACGNAADLGCTRGKIWLAHFIPASAGRWAYRVSFRAGADIVAAGTDGQPVIGVDGATGEFSVGAMARDAVRARGLLQYTGEPYYRWSGSLRPYFKFGVDSPENTLAYAAFDNTPDVNGFRKTWAPHVRDFDPLASAYLWGRERKGDGLLGRFNYLRGAGLTGASMLLFNVGGDDRNVVPQLLKVTKEAYASMAPQAQWTDGVHHDRYDAVKLAQWQRALSYADAIGLHLHFKTQEVENNLFMDGGILGRERRIYLREMLARFNGFLAVTWNLGEENTQDPTVVGEVSRYVESLDPYHHPIVMHTFPQQKERYRPLLGDASALNGLSLQGMTIDFSDMRADIIKWSTAARRSGRPWVIGYDELGTAIAGAPIDEGYPVASLKAMPVVPFAIQDVQLAVHSDSADGLQAETAPTRRTYRRQAIWNAFTAGANGIEMYYGWLNRCHDLGCEDDRTRAHKFADGATARHFFDTHVANRALTMVADDELSSDSSDYVFADHGRTYVIFTASGKPVYLRPIGQTGQYSVAWYDAVTGGELRTGSVAIVDGGVAAHRPGPIGDPSEGYTDLGDPPPGGSGEWAILVRRVDAQPR